LSEIAEMTEVTQKEDVILVWGTVRVWRGRSLKKNGVRKWSGLALIIAKV
jgi:hypothetical protein